MRALVQEGNAREQRGASIRLIKVRHAYHRPKGRLAVLEKIDLTVAPHEKLAIVGPSSSGKSTLLKLIMGRMPPTEGQVEVQAVGSAPLRTAVLFQEPALLPWLTAEQNVRLPLELAGRQQEAGAAVNDILTRSGLAEFAAFRPAQLSGGMQSRLALARALVTEPDLLLLDEPFGNLDEITAETLLVDLAAQVHRLGTTVVFITHVLSHAVFLADRVVILSARPGRIADILTMAGGQSRDAAYFETPAFAASVGAIRQKLKEAVHASAV